MFLSRWRRWLSRVSQRSRQRRPRIWFRPACEPLETRLCPSLLVGNDDRIARFDEVTCAYLGDFVQKDTGLGFTTDMALGPDGNLYVVTGGEPGTIRRYDGTTEAFKDVFAQGGNLRYLADLTFGPDGKPYVISLHIGPGIAAQILRYDANPDPQQPGTWNPVISLPDVANPRSLTFGPDGNLYVLAAHPGNGYSAGHVAYRFNGSTYAFIDYFTQPDGQPVNDYQKMRFGPDGNL
jgi:hypothetical protein